MRESGRQLLCLRTAEGIVFEIPLAGPASRMLAWAIDEGVVIGLSIGVTLVVRLGGMLAPDLAAGLGTVLYFALRLGYPVGMEWAARGQTIGKRILGLRVMDEHGLRLKFQQVLVRNLMRVVDALPAFYFVGGVASVWGRQGQRLGDLVAGTVVAKVEKVGVDRLGGLGEGGVNSLRAFPHLAARLRQRVSPEEAAVALAALLRRDQFDPAARVELFAEIAGGFRKKVAFPVEALEGIGDEHYVRNVVDVVFRSKSQLH